MTFTVNPWVVTLVLSLALFGVVWWWQWTRDAARDARAWWRDRRDARESGVPVSGFRRLRAWGRDRGEEDEGGRIGPPWWWKPWLRLLRAGPPLEDMPDDGPELCDRCLNGTHCDAAEPFCDCTCGWDEDWAEELPPERSAEALGFTGSDRNADDLMDGGGLWHGPHAPESAEVRQWRGLEARRERLASAAELEHRAAYEAMGLEFPSGLMARVREAAQ